MHGSHQPERVSVRFGISNGSSVFRLEPDASAFRLMRQVLLRLLVFSRVQDTARLERSTLLRGRLTSRGAMKAPEEHDVGINAKSADTECFSETREVPVLRPKWASLRTSCWYQCPIG